MLQRTIEYEGVASAIQVIELPTIFLGEDEGEDDRKAGALEPDLSRFDSESEKVIRDFFDVSARCAPNYRSNLGDVGFIRPCLILVDKVTHFWSFEGKMKSASFCSESRHGFNVCVGDPRVLKAVLCDQTEEMLKTLSDRGLTLLQRSFSGTRRHISITGCRCERIFLRDESRLLPSNTLLGVICE